MKVIDSTWQGSEITDGEERDSLREQIDNLPTSDYLKQSYSSDPQIPQQKTAHAFIAAYTPNDGIARWVTYYGDTSGTEYIEHGTYTEAERAYEARVRELNDARPEEPFWWDVTDVEGVQTNGK